MCGKDRLGGILASLGAAAAGVAAHALATRGLVPGAALAAYVAPAGALAFALLGLGAYWKALRREHAMPLVLSAWGGFLVASALTEIVPALLLPYDIVSFAESPYINDVIKLRTGVPLYGPAGDNDSYPYPPGSQILTYALASIWGGGDSVAGLRLTSFAYVVFAALLAAAAARRIAQGAGGGDAPSLGHWSGWLLAAALLGAVDHEFNLYVHSLHNDSLALLISAFGMWLIARERAGRQTAHFLATILLPVAGFFAKQSMLVWIGLFAVARVGAGLPLRRAILGVACSAALAAIVIGAVSLAAGDDFVYWVFRALGDKEVSPARSLLHFLGASPWVAVGAVGAWARLGRGGSRTAPELRGFVAAWAVMFLIQVWTSGIGWQVNHVGPAVLMATVLALAALPSVLPRFAAAVAPRGGGFVAVAAVVFVTIWLGWLRLPAARGAGDAIEAHAAAIEREFVGIEAGEVLLDNGSWIYLRSGIVMKDRSAPAALHAGMNQALNRDALAETIGRIRGGRYRKILVHDLSAEPGIQSWYDFHERGTGVNQAIESRYRLARRIPGGRADFPGWMESLASDVLVYERIEGTPAPPDDTPHAPPVGR